MQGRTAWSADFWDGRVLWSTDFQEGRAAAKSADIRERCGCCSKEPTTAVPSCIQSAHGGDVAANPKVGRSIHMKLMVCGRRRDRFFQQLF